MHRAARSKIGAFEVEYIYVTHSTIDCVALAVRTPLGVIIHTGDFKMDPTPIDGLPFDLHALRAIRAGGRVGAFQRQHQCRKAGIHAIRETSVWSRIEELCRAAPRKVLISCFASSIPRIQQVMNIAAACGRKVGLCRPEHGR